MRKLIIYLTIFLLMATPAFGRLKPKSCWRKSGGGNFSLPFAGSSTHRDAVPSGVWTIREGDLWYETDTDTLKVYDGANWDTVVAPSGAISLDEAYDASSDGGGRTITANDGAVTINCTGDDANPALAVGHSGNAAGDGITITVSGNAQDAIEIENTATGYDIEGTGALWYATKAGLLYGTTITSAGDTLLTGAAANIQWDASENTLEVLDDAYIAFGDDDDVTIRYDETTNDALEILAAALDTTLTIGGTTNGFDMTWYHETSGTVLFDFDDDLVVDGMALQINDDDELHFGDSEEFIFEYDEDSSDNLLISCANANDAVQFGNATTNMDVIIAGATANDIITFDASADEAIFEDYSIQIMDDTEIFFGDGDDASIKYDETTSDALEIYSSKDIDIDSSAEDITISVNAAGKDLNLDSVLGSINIEAEEDAADAILIDADGGTSSTLRLVSTTGTSVTEDAAALTLHALAGGISIQSDADLDDAIVILADGGTTAEILIHNDQGTAADSIHIDTDDGSIDIDSGDNLDIDVADDYTLDTADGGVSITAGGSGNGDITLTAGDDLVLAVTGTFNMANAIISNNRITTATDADNLTLTQAMSGQTIVFTMTGAAGTATLPELTSANVGMWFILVDGNPAVGRDLSVDPEGVGTINGDTAGHKITCENDRDGEAVYIFGTAADTWYTVALGSSTVWTEE